jgi:hypothetical protein
LRLPPVAEGAFALWLTVFGVDEAKWRQQAEALRASGAEAWLGRAGSAPPQGRWRASIWPACAQFVALCHRASTGRLAAE